MTRIGLESSIAIKKWHELDERFLRDFSSPKVLANFAFPLLNPLSRWAMNKVKSIPFLVLYFNVYLSSIPNWRRLTTTSRQRWLRRPMRESNSGWDILRFFCQYSLSIHFLCRHNFYRWLTNSGGFEKDNRVNKQYLIFDLFRNLVKRNPQRPPISSISS